MKLKMIFCANSRGSNDRRLRWALIGYLISAAKFIVRVKTAEWHDGRRCWKERGGLLNEGRKWHNYPVGIMCYSRRDVMNEKPRFFDVAVQCASVKQSVLLSVKHPPNKKLHRPRVYPPTCFMDPTTIRQVRNESWKPLKFTLKNEEDGKSNSVTCSQTWRWKTDLNQLLSSHYVTLAHEVRRLHKNNRMDGGEGVKDPAFPLMYEWVDVILVAGSRREVSLRRGCAPRPPPALQTAASGHAALYERGDRTVTWRLQPSTGTGLWRC